MNHISPQVTPSETALVIIDMQQVYFEAPALQEQQSALVAACNELAAAFRACSRPVLLVRTVHQPTRETWTLSMLDDDQGYLFDGTNEVALLPGLKVMPGDWQLTKVRDSAFHATLLEQLLAQSDSRAIVLAGVSTHTCVAQTAADAYARNIRVVLADGAVATHEPRFHTVTLDLFEHEYRQPYVKTGEIIDWLRASRQP